MTTQGPTEADREAARELVNFMLLNKAGAALVGQYSPRAQAESDAERIAQALAAARKQGLAEGRKEADDEWERESAIDDNDAELKRQGLVRINHVGQQRDGMTTIHLWVAPPPGHILDDKGVVRRVLGTLPVTADGVVVGDCAEVWITEGPDEPIACVHLDKCGYSCEAEGFWPVDECYSTREAAIAARGNT